MANRELSPRLPPPDAQALAHSERLQQVIRAEMEASGGRVSFARFMELALYTPGLGYYSAGSHKLGREGDFVTAPEISPLFGRCLARQCAQVLSLLGSGDVLELGAGTGKLAVDLLGELRELGTLPQRYLILEVSADLRERQRQLIEQRLPALEDRVHWLDRLPEAGFRGVVLANEVMDALPAQRFRIEQQGLSEYGVAWEDGRFVWRYYAAGAVLAGAVAELLQALPHPLAPGYSSEIHLMLGPWIRSLGAMLEAGLVLLVDYGFPRREYYHPQRSEGTLMCHYRHRSHSDPLILIGLQDITAHVDFTAVAKHADAAGLKVAGYTSQGKFLIASGLLALDPRAADTHAQLRWAAEVKTLTLESEMGELFKVMALTRGLHQPLLGFAGVDQRGRL